MGLLVAGITGGASLIKASRLKRIIDEIRYIKTAYNTFYVQYGRVPGSTSNDPYSTIATGNGKPAKELKEMGFIDNKTNDIQVVYSKNIANLGYALSHVIDLFENDNIKASGVIVTQYPGGIKRVFSHKDAKNIDAKIDDGLPKMGDVRATINAFGNAPYTNDEYLLSDEIAADLVIKLDF
jgi:hypothetical protein